MHSLKHRGSGVPQNRKPTEYTMPLPSRITTSKELVSVCNDHKALAKFLNGKTANNKVNRWELELATYNIKFKWMSGAQNKAADCLSRLVKLPTNCKATINCSQPQIWMDQHSTQEAKPYINTKQTQILNLQVPNQSRKVFTPDFNCSGNHRGYHTKHPNSQ